jgi:hypothetical protein
LINAIATHFPAYKTKHLLCRWHINMDVVKHCKGAFPTTEEWDDFYKKWQGIVYAPTEQEYDDKLDEFETDNSIPRDCKNYLYTTWLEPWHHKFVGAWIDQFTHFNITASLWYIALLILKSYFPNKL